VDQNLRNEVDNICEKVFFNHVEPLEYGNMKFIVIHANNKAIFVLKSRNDTFGMIKKNISEYFGLPISKIFLSNNNNEIYLSMQRVANELFPLKSSKSKNEYPTIFVNF
jgi:hypothetical protein